MKKVFKILLASALVLVTMLMCIGCNDNVNKEGEKGLLVKKIDGVYTIYDYVDDGNGVETLDIGSVLQQKGITEQYNIKSGAFDGNKTLTKIIVSKDVKEIAEGAFKNMHNLRALEVPFVGKTAKADAYFKESASATDKSTDKARTIAHFFGAEKYNEGKKVTINYGGGAANCYVPINFNEIIVNAASDYSIPMHAFDGAVNLTKVTIKGVDAIGEGAFNGCINIKNITIPSSVKTIYAGAFNGCTKLEKIFVENGAQIDVKETAFNGCVKVQYFGKVVDNAPMYQVDLSNVNSAAANAFNFGGATYKVLNAKADIDLTLAFGNTKFN